MVSRHFFCQNLNWNRDWHVIYCWRHNPGGSPVAACTVSVSIHLFTAPYCLPATHIQVLLVHLVSQTTCYCVFVALEMMLVPQSTHICLYTTSALSRCHTFTHMKCKLNYTLRLQHCCRPRFCVSYAFHPLISAVLVPLYPFPHWITLKMIKQCKNLLKSNTWNNLLKYNMCLFIN